MTQRQIEYLSEFMLPGRFDTLQRVVAERTRWMTVLMENTFHPQNASALVRHCDAFGVQDIYTVETLCKFRPNVDIVRGSDRWVTFHHNKSSASAIEGLRSRGYRIVATTPHRGDCRPEYFDVTAGKFALVFGTEHAGISDEVIAASDEFIRIPMRGFVESLNVSASAAILLYILSEKLRASDVPWRLTPEERTAQLLLWMRRSVKDSDEILARLDDDKK